MASRITTEEFKKKLFSMNPTIKVVGEYCGNKTGIECICCQCGFAWQPLPSNILRGHGCPQCGKKKRENSRYEGLINSGRSLREWCLSNPEIGRKLLKEWDMESNLAYSLDTITYGSEKLANWKCSECGNKWLASPNNRTQGRGCPTCSNRIVQPGVNDLATTHPDLAIQWDYTKNKDLTPQKITYGSTKSIFWKCIQCGKTFSASPNNRTSSKTNSCPYCNHKTVDGDRTSFGVKYRGLALEWDSKKNSLSPNDVFPNSKYQAWWICSVCGNSWKMSVERRINGGHCSQCGIRNKTSFPEQAIFYYIKKQYKDALIHYTDIFDNAMELDIYIPSLKIGIEYDGEAWHHSKADETRETKKYSICKENGIQLVRVKEKIENSYVNSCDVLIHSDYDRDRLQQFNKTLHQLGMYVKIRDIDCERDKYLIENEYLTVLRENRLSITYPELVDQWDNKQNKGLVPDMFSAGSGEVVFWKCERGHSWRAPIYNRVKGMGCPYCSNQKVWRGYNDLEFVAPKLLAEWNYSMNTLRPDEVYYASNKKYWWKCKTCGSEWMSSPYNRIKKQQGCPVCTNNITRTGINDLKTTHPIIALEWDNQKNIETFPEDVVAGSTKMVWWKCNKDHSWQARIRERVKGNGCPYCANKKVLPGYNDLQTLRPEIIEEWDFKKNIKIKPTQVTIGSSKRVWWKCNSCGNEWEAPIYSRTKGRGCRKCAHKKK